MAYWRDYWNYYEPAVPRKVKDGIKAKSQRGAIGETWWSKRWLGVLESFGMGARLTRGRSYARMGQVISINIESGIVTAEVQGTQKKPYAVEIRLKPLSDKDWEKVTDAMAARAIFAAKLLSGEMPQNIEEAFSKVKISLFPISDNDLKTHCSCPDWANPCKHIAAVYYIIAEKFDEDPFLIFKLRGRTKDEILQTLRKKRSRTLPKKVTASSLGTDFTQDDNVIPLEKCLNTLWYAGEALSSFTVSPSPPEVDNAILKTLGESPFKIGNHDIASLLRKAYSIASTSALQKALGE